MNYQQYGDISQAKQVIIMSHGFLAKQIDDKDYHYLIDKLVKRGKAVISFQYVGMLDRTHLKRYTVEDWQQQLMCIYNNVMQNYPKCQIHFFGVSFGNWLIASLITQFNICPTSVIAIAPVYSSYMSMVTGGPIGAKHRQDNYLHHVEVHPSLIDALINQSPIYFLNHYHIPTCLLWGDLDKSWRYSDCYLMHHHLLDKQILTTFKIIKEGTHTLKNSDKVIAMLEQSVLSWLENF